LPVQFSEFTCEFFQDQAVRVKQMSQSMGQRQETEVLYLVDEDATQQVPCSSVPGSQPLDYDSQQFNCAQPLLAASHELLEEENEQMRQKIRLLFEILNDPQLKNFLEERANF